MVEKFKISNENSHGNCPECGFLWDKGDAMEMVKQNFPFLPDNILLNMAKNQFGWTPDNPKRFTHLIHIEPSDVDVVDNGLIGYYQCPNCNIAWDDIDGTRTDKFKIMMDNYKK